MANNDHFKCPYCRSDLIPTVTTTNTNGNIGRRYVICKSWPPGQFGPGIMSHQRFFRWVDRTPSPPISQSVDTSTILPSPPSTMPFQDISIAPTTSIPLPATISCIFSGCKLKRAPAQDCHRHMCRTHCQLSGGCLRKDHINKAPTISTPPGPSLHPSTSSNYTGGQPPPPPNSAIDPVLRTQQSPQPQQSERAQLQPHSSQYAVQIPPIFTEQQAALQRTDADRRTLQATLRHNETQSKNVVRAFAWSENDSDPISYDFSLPPGSRNFEVTESILCDLALISEDNDTPGSTRLQKYDVIEEIWVGFKIGQVYDAEAHRRRFFFKRQEVKDCLGFDSHIGQAVSSLHMRDNLTGERSYVRKTLLQKRAAKLITPSPAFIPLSSSLPSSLSSSSLSPNVISISSDDETDLNLCIPIPTLPLSNTRKRSHHQSPEVIIVLDSDEEDEAVVKKQRMDKEVKQEDEVKIKTERSTSHVGMLPPLAPQHDRRVHQPFVETVFHSEDDSLKWPQDYFVCDVAKAFKDPPRGVSKKAAFQAYFPGLLFKKSTYYDNYNLWIRTPTNLCTKHTNYGRTPKGSWKEFLVARARYFNQPY
jgi:hypothetical protein